MKELLIATKNPGKFSEIVEVLSDLPFSLIFLGEMVVDDSNFAEDGANFRENAQKKASYYAGKTGLLTLGEDSGIVVDALEGELGVKTRRWGAGESATDEEWINYFMDRMKDEEVRTAKFVCSSCLFKPEDFEEYFEGKTKGEISDKLLVPILPGLPLSSVFVPEGFDKAYAELKAHEKNKVSHRGKALHQVKSYLSKFQAY